MITEYETALRAIASTPKQDEPEEEGSLYRQDWTDEGGKYAIEALHHIIDIARAVLSGGVSP